MITKDPNPSPDIDGDLGSLMDAAYKLIEEDIVTLRLEPGSMISESILSKRYNIGRMPIREALQRLAREHLVDIMPRRGVYISKIDIMAQIRLLEVRRELERLLARSAARRATPEQRAKFREIADEMTHAAAPVDDVLFMRKDQEFNLLLLEAARNDFATSAMGLMSGLSRRFWYRHYKQVADLPRAAHLHSEMALAISEGNEADAMKATDVLMDYLEEIARATVSADK